MLLILRAKIVVTGQIGGFGGPTGWPAPYRQDGCAAIPHDVCNGIRRIQFPESA